MSKTIEYRLKEVDHIAERLIAEAAPEQVIWTFTGQIGAGKTTLIKALCRILGSREAVSSPTFSLVNEYEDREGQTFFHMDLYRLNDTEEALDIGIEEYLDSGQRCLIEWPGLIEHLLPEDTFRIKLEIGSDSSRKIIFL
ncbi:MAG: tRNA (adenosine(37)-N6)-threonylcarbamoyltransferase complex ATPase subunit type 1 TsaE [Phaeodactylibacter sp.]|uniref:tRNA (adenosine(37)-N6)-threonylcarbamoyltransferase complex ATPase subunit type 1 TsaE n=1 Tax=Phaeodactylibacter sp. TaxID=1940289 RepID=UPI0032F00667